jgi:hypothetical protein
VNGAEWSICSGCGQKVHNSANGWRKHVEFCPSAPMTDLERTQENLGHTFGVSRSQVGAIVRREDWTHV